MKRRLDRAARVDINGPLRRGNSRVAVHHCFRCRADATTTPKAARPEGWQVVAWTGERLQGEGYALLCPTCAGLVLALIATPPPKEKNRVQLDLDWKDNEGN